MGGFLVLQQQQQHGEKTMDRIGVLAVARCEVSNREGVEGSKRERVTVNDEEGRLLGVRHPLRLQAASDTRSLRCLNVCPLGHPDTTSSHTQTHQFEHRAPPTRLSNTVYLKGHHGRPD